MENKEGYLDEIIAELMADDEWQLPKECRFVLTDSMLWMLMYS